MPEAGRDDVIRIRIDTAWAVGEFLDLLRRQAAEGETRAPANPANRAVFRELAPYLLVEYEYVDPAIGTIDGVYVGFPDGTVYSASEEIPESLVDDLVAGDVPSLPPLYVYLVPAAPKTLDDIDRFLGILARHMGHPVVGIMRGADGAALVRAYDGEGADAAAGGGPLADQARAGAREAGRHVSRRQLLAGLDARNAADGRAYALFHYDYGRHVVAFATAGERDDFVAWSRWVAEVLDASADAGRLGGEGVSRPAEPCAAPARDVPVTPLPGPRQWNGGRAWIPPAGETAPPPSAIGEYLAMVTGAVRGASQG
ncbi:MAG: hypothetical protein M0006_13560 [Magnetospirillum sp.]|nr:hypothetical protein [Magnetospirillum sp.]